MANEMQDPLGFFTQDKDQSPEAVEAYFKARARADFDSIIFTAQTYGTEAGKRELARLRAATIESAAWMPSLAQQYSIEAANAHAYAREGQNALVRDIERRIELAKKIKTPEDLYDLMVGGQNGMAFTTTV